MDALTSSWSKKIIASSCYGRSGASFCRARLLGPAEIRFVPSLKLDSCFSISRQSISLLQKPIRSSSSPAAPAEADSESVETQTQLSYQSKTVHVKFQLHRECQFGEHFFLAGDDPIFGLWDPANAILLDWSEGHVWTIGLDIPIGKTMQFKFILKGINGEILWQPGPDRCFQTWETENTIIVSEDWENADLQKVTEEPLADLIEVSEANATGDLLVNLAEESMANLTEEPNLVELVAGSNIGAVNNENLISMEDAKIPISNGGPVLVPGLTATPAPKSSTEEAFLKEVTNGMVTDLSVAADEATNRDTPELSGKQEHETSNGSLPKEETLMTYNAVLEEKPNDKGPEEMASDGGPEEAGSGHRPEEQPHLSEEPNPQLAAVGVLTNDVHWAGKMLQKLIFNLGFLKNQQLN